MTFLTYTDSRESFCSAPGNKRKSFAVNLDTVIKRRKKGKKENNLSFEICESTSKTEAEWDEGGGICLSICSRFFASRKINNIYL
jgi:hypothetical protein